jgi:molecular chaperone GrpE
MSSESETEPPAPETPDAAPTDDERLAAMEAENLELRDRVLRAAAEMDHLRKRTDREIRDTRAYAIAGFARDMLGATDNLSRALAALPDEERAGADEAIKALIEGVELTEREMQRLMENNGVRRIDPKGEKFDPHFHQAMFEIANPDVPDNSVLEVVQSGYVIGERMLRPALVGVARGGPKMAAEAANAGRENDPDADAAARETRPDGAESPDETGIDKTV